MTGRIWALATLPAVMMTSGCVTNNNLDTAPKVGFEALIRQIKYDIGTYDFRHKDDKFLVPAPTAPADETQRQMQEAEATSVKNGEARYANPGQQCLGQVNITIEKVKMTVAATHDAKGGASGGLEVPIGIVTLSAGGSMTRSNSDSVTTTLEFNRGPGTEAEPAPTSPPPPSPVFEGTPIADTLDSLGRDLVATSDTRPCFSFDAEGGLNTIKWGFTVVRGSSGSGKLKLLLFSLGAENSETRTVANTVEVTFRAFGGFGD